MADATLREVIERMKAEGQLTRNTGTNSIKTVKELITHMRDRDEESARDASERNQQLAEIKQALMDGDEEAVEVITKSDDNLTTGDDLENLREEVKRELETIELLREIRDNTAGMGRPQKEEEDTSGPGVVAIGAGALAVGAALGAAAGIIRGNLKALETLVPPIKTLRESITRQFRLLRVYFNRTLPRQLRAIGTSITEGFQAFRTGLVERFVRFGDTLADIFRPLGRLFAPIQGAIRSIGGLNEDVVNIFKEAGEEIAKIRNFKFPRIEIPGGKMIAESFETVGRFIRQVGTVFSSVASTVGKLFAPLALIMGVFDAVSGAIKGFNEDEGGYVSKFFAGFEGALEGVLNGLVGIPLDLLKSGVAWIAGKLGFDNAVETLESFSFADIISDLVAIPFDLVRTAVAEIGKVFSLFQDDEGNFRFPSINELLMQSLTGLGEVFRKAITSVADLFGFDEFSQKIAEMDFGEEMDKILDGIIETTSALINGVVEGILNIKDQVQETVAKTVDFVSEFVKDVLKNVLPDPNKERGFFDPTRIAVAALDKFGVYEYAGMRVNNPDDYGDVMDSEIADLANGEAPPPAIDVDQLESDMDGVNPNQNQPQFETEQSPQVDGSQTEVEKPAMTEAEAKRLQLEQEQKENAAAAQTANTTAVVVGDTNVQTNNNTTNSNTTVGMTSTSGDPNDSFWSSLNPFG